MGFYVERFFNDLNNNLARYHVFLRVTKSEVMEINVVFHTGQENADNEEFHSSHIGRRKKFYISTFSIGRGFHGVISIDAAFKNFEPFIIYDFIKNASHYPEDTQLIVDNQNVNVHRQLLCMISPVLKAAFSHDTEEARTGTIKITDFSFETVKATINFCYGRVYLDQLQNNKIDVLRFAEKYDIQTIMNLVEPILFKTSSIDNFCSIAEYAWDCVRKDLQLKCAQFYRANVNELTLTTDFVNMGSQSVYGILSMAINLSDYANVNAESDNDDDVKKYIYITPTILNFITDSDHYQSDAQITVGNERLDVHRYVLNLISPIFHSKLAANTSEAKSGIIKINDYDFATVKNVIDYCYGHECPAKTCSESLTMLSFAKTYKIRPIVEALELYLQVELSLDNFYPIVQHAWDFEMTELKSKCAHFYKENYNKMIFTEEFVNMNPKIQVELNREAANIKEYRSFAFGLPTDTFYYLVTTKNIKFKITNTDQVTLS